MDKTQILHSLGKKSSGEIYLGVVGAVRTGKSTFIKKCIETLILPYMDDEIEKKRCLDEIPQTAPGKTIMTIEPKFVPSNAANIKIDDFTSKVRLIDCVGYVIEGAKGYEDEKERISETLRLRRIELVWRAKVCEGERVPARRQRMPPLCGIIANACSLPTP